MKVWLVFKSYPALDAVNDDLDIANVDVSEVMAVCGTAEKAEQRRAELQAQFDQDVEDCDCDPIEVIVGAWDVE